MSRLVPQEKIRYVQKTFAIEDAPLKAVGEGLSEDQRRMQVGPEEGKLLHVLLTMIGAQKGVEIGTLHGYSAIWIARALAENGHLWVVEKNHKRIQPATENFHACGVADTISLIQGDALQILPTLNDNGPFDFVFIDANKENYVEYLDWAEANVRKGGLIIGDNSFLFGHVTSETPPEDYPEKSWRAMRSFNQRLADSTRYTSILIPTEEGLTVAIKNF